MEQRRNQRQAGFTLIETVVVIVVLGVLTAAVAVNWASFIRHQELRQDAINLHKEIMALKARAIEHGEQAWLECALNGNQCAANWLVPNQDNPAADPAASSRRVTLNNSVEILDEELAAGGDLTAAINTEKNTWVSGNTVKIEVKADNLEAFSEGKILIRRGNSNERYCIQMDGSTIRPELYYKSGSGAWKRM